MGEHDDASTNLARMTRDELNAYAGERGIADAADTDAYPTKADLIAAVEAAEPSAPPDNGDDAEAGARYRVLKAITHADGHTSMPGDEVTLDPAEWPARRAKQLVEQQFLRPIE